ncbi:MAG: 3-phosphoshikimate 1-carboxyvinyltransferase [Candidatus Omnitrophica bacterium]|nr:3-phosphoshikimate 1-carboxyvinyltransferase [Candidatus Omnitrophota bacterium]MDD5429251.1 3-phosphoshikimate 1-carboxyvinyltransferase [Candidatus Omnitrophota bacterium]
MSCKIEALKNAVGTVNIPADKSISHRAVILASVCEGITEIKNFLNCSDTDATVSCLKKLGVKVYRDFGSLVVKGKGMQFALNKPVELYANESGTTMRILSGLLSAQKFTSIFDGSTSLRRRPMARVIEPLNKMGARITGSAPRNSSRNSADTAYPPLSIFPAKGKLEGIEYELPVASAQVKSAVMLAALYADGPTMINEPCACRDHTERMLKLFKAKVEVKETVKAKGKKETGAREIFCYPASKLVSPGELSIPSDFSSAAFFIVLGLLLKDSEIMLKDINLNPTRLGLLNVLKRMGADIKEVILESGEGREPRGNLTVKASSLSGVTVASDEIPLMIDEIPILCVAAAAAKGKTLIEGVSELKVKETDRMAAILYNLRQAGIKVSITPENSICIKGGFNCKREILFKSFGDHRTAMSAVVLGSVLGNCSIDEISCIKKSFPDFISLLKSLRSRK